MKLFCGCDCAREWGLDLVAENSGDPGEKLRSLFEEVGDAGFEGVRARGPWPVVRPQTEGGPPFSKCDQKDALNRWHTTYLRVTSVTCVALPTSRACGPLRPTRRRIERGGTLSPF